MKRIECNQLRNKYCWNSSAAIRSDRWGGTVNVNGGTYKTTGQGSPSIYSTTDITVKNVVEM